MWTLNPMIWEVNGVVLCVQTCKCVYKNLQPARESRLTLFRGPGWIHCLDVEMISAVLLEVWCLRPHLALAISWHAGVSFLPQLTPEACASLSAQGYKGQIKISLSVLVVPVEQHLCMNGELLHVQELKMTLIFPRNQSCTSTIQTLQH